MLMKAKAAARRTENINTDVPIALVIGSGFGGLAAAVRLAAKGLFHRHVVSQQDLPLIYQVEGLPTK